MDERDQRIYVLTRGRLGNQLTLRNIWNRAPRWRERTTLVCPSNEMGRHNWRDCIPCDAPNLSFKRDFCVERGPRFQIQLDDDLLDFRWRPGDHTRQVACVGDQIDQLFDDLFEKLTDDYAHVGVSQRSGNNRVEADYDECCRMCDCLGYDTWVIKEHGLKFSDMILMQDFHMTLSLIEWGYKNYVNYKFSVGQQFTARTLGGCSLYRTPQLMEEQSKRLAELHAPFVKLIRKAPKTWGMGEFTDVRIEWKKALGSKLP